MSEQKKTIDIDKLDQQLDGTVKKMEVAKTDFLAKLSDDMLEDVSGGFPPMHYNEHGNISITN